MGEEALGSQPCTHLSFSNLGGSGISETVLQLLRAGLAREDITLEDLAPRLQAEMATGKGGGAGVAGGPHSWGLTALALLQTAASAGACW